MAHSSKLTKPKRPGITKPKKPRKDFPLSPHGSGKWQKKIGGKLYYLGRWAKREEGQLVRVENDGWREAEREYNKWLYQRLHGHKQLSEADATMSIGKLCNMFLAMKKDAVEVGKLSPSTFTDYKQATDLIAATFDSKRLVVTLGPLDFQSLRSKMDKRWNSPDRISKFVTTIRSVFKYAADSKLITQSVAFGPQFARPSQKEFRKHKAAGGQRMFTAIEIDELLNGRTEKGKLTPGAGGQLRAMVLLGINCGFGNTDCGTLPITAVDFKQKIISYPRPKTAIDRRCLLWSETIAALRNVIKSNKHGLVFVTEWGNPWVNRSTDAVSKEFTKVLKRLHINGRRSLGFYTLRHTFQTIADETLDFPAIGRIMGHAPSGMAARYRERIDDKRLRAVAEHVRSWLFGKSRLRKPK
jgi:integrase